MSTANITVFLNKKNLRNASRDNIILPAIASRWGGYYTSGLYGGRANYSEKAIAEFGYELAQVTKAEADRIKRLEVKRSARLEAKRVEAEMAKRERAVEVCLAADPLEVKANDEGNPLVQSVVDLAGTPFIEVYHGCGRGTAYVKAGKLIAYHYGHRQPVNAPTGEDVQAIHCHLSGTQVCL